MAKFRFHTTREYFDELILGVRATKKGDRVLLMTMTYEPLEPIIAALNHELLQAANRGVFVTLAVDAHSLLVGRNHFPSRLIPRAGMPTRLPPYFRNKLDFIQSLDALPTGMGIILNLPENSLNLPIAGRSHIKIAIINSRIFLGGCNLLAEDLIDLMIDWESQPTADMLYAIMGEVARGKNVRRVLAQTDRNLRVDDHTVILIDSGVKGQSIIYKQALDLIDNAQKWLVVTGQYFPNSITAKHLLKAVERGVKVEVIFSHPSHHGPIGGFGQQISIFRERTRLPAILFNSALAKSDPMLHAKLIASDAGMMIGSHNYVRAGVMLGTAEIAFKSTDEKLAREAVTTLHRGLRRINNL
jgi:phosphatidylserine/phosphatidylglycerophosphate/cardiolipin synthase-like enzyme